MATTINTVFVPLEEHDILVKDSADLQNVIKLLNTEFPDTECQLIAIKSILGIEEAESDEPEQPSDDAENEDEVIEPSEEETSAQG